MHLNPFDGVADPVRPPLVGWVLLRGSPDSEIQAGMSADAHEPGRVADRFEMTLNLLSEIGFTEVSVVLDLRRHAISISKAKASLEQKINF